MRIKVMEKIKKEEVKRDKTKWYPFFLLLPRMMDNTFVWLEWVERKNFSHIGCWYSLRAEGLKETEFRPGE